MTKKECPYQLEELLSIVEVLTIQHTSNQSSSITVETAKALLSAVNYCIQENAQTFEVHPSAQLNDDEERQNSIWTNQENHLTAKMAYEKGYNLVIQKVKRALSLYNDIMEDFRGYGNIAYYDTIVEGMPAFFQYYDPKFEPENHLLTLDYPIIKSVYHLNGVDAIYEYLSSIMLEQVFLQVYQDDCIVNLLKRYDENYRELLFNIPEVVFQNAIGCLIVKKPVAFLKLERSDLSIIKNFAEGKAVSQLEEEIQRLLRTMIQVAYQGNEALYDYLSSNVHDFAVRLLNSAENSSLEALFPVCDKCL